MKVLKRAGVILMVLGFMVSLFGCSKDPAKHGVWQSFSLHRTSSVMTDAYHFTVRKAENGGMTVTGFCYGEESEYRIEEEVFLSDDAAIVLSQMELEKLPTYKPKKLPQAMDGAQTTASVTHSDGTERKIVLTDEIKDEIVSLLQSALKSAVRSASDSERGRIG